MALSPDLIGFEFSPQQRRVWRQSPGVNESPFLATGTLQFQGNITAEELENAWQMACAHFEILRSDVIDVPALEYPLFQVAGVDKHTPSPLIHHQIETGPNQTLNLHLSGPSFLFDTASFDLLGEWLVRALKGVSQAPAIAYFDLSQWQNKLLTHPENEHHLGYWRHWRWADLTRMDLEWAFQENASTVYSPKRYEYQAEQAPPQAISDLANYFQADPDAVLLAAWAFLLSQVFQAPSLIVGVRMDGRPFEDMENVLGHFEKQLPIPFQIASATAFAEILRATTENYEDAFDRQEFFSWHPSLAKTLIDQAGFFPFGFETDGPRPRFELDGLVVQGKEISVFNERNHFRLCIRREAAKNSWVLVYDQNRFHEAFAKDLLIRLEAFLRALIQEPELNIRRLNLLTPEEEHTVQSWNGNSLQLPFVSLPEKFRQAATKAPHLPGLICGDAVYSWSTLAQASSTLAKRLLATGIKSDQLLPLITQRSVSHLIGLLGINLAGAGFVPLEATLPEMRLRNICRELDAPFILTETALADALPPSVPKILIDAENYLDGTCENAIAFPEISPAQTAYAIYTSGSTGSPKAVVVSHGALSNYLNAIQDTLNLEPCQSFTMVSTLAADLGYTALFPALALGATLHLIQQDVFFDPNRFAEYIAQHQIDAMKVVPSYLEVLLQSQNPQRVLPKKCLILGGEKASESLLKQLHELEHTCKIFNHYGPTETTIGVLTNPLPHDSTILPLGRPLPNSQAYVLTAGMLQVPRGKSGRLFIGGPQLARGYLNQPAQTAAVFIPDPFGSKPGSRLYDTGDLIHWRRDNQLVFQGRMDHQLKIRGYRVELGEIEAQLANYPSVKRATVHAFSQDQQQTHLMGYWIPNRDIKHPEIESEAIRAFLQKTLPEYMVPTEILMMHQFPLSANGKLDRKRLPGPGSTRLKKAEHLQLPRTPEEKTIAEVWSSFLPLKTFSIHDNFFDLGGNSYLMFKIQSALHSHLNKKIGIMDLFKNPTIALLAEALGTLSEGSSDLSHIDQRVQRRLQARQQRTLHSSRRTS